MLLNILQDRGQDDGRIVLQGCQIILVNAIANLTAADGSQGWIHGHENGPRNGCDAFCQYVSCGSCRSMVIRGCFLDAIDDNEATLERIQNTLRFFPFSIEQTNKGISSKTKIEDCIGFRFQ